MRFQIMVVLMVFAVGFATPSFASLPYYNSELGYTIWLPEQWTPAPDNALSSVDFKGYDFIGHVEGGGWEAGYVRARDGETPALLVEVNPCKRVPRNVIGDFNAYIVRSFQKLVKKRTGQAVALEEARYFKERNTLRIKTLVRDEQGGRKVSLLYIVYTRTGMLKFVGMVGEDDRAAMKVIDDAVLSVYLDERVRY